MSRYVVDLPNLNILVNQGSISSRIAEPGAIRDAEHLIECIGELLKHGVVDQGTHDQMVAEVEGASAL